MSIANVKAFLSQNFLSPIKNWPKKIHVFFGGGGRCDQNVEFWFWDHKRHILAQNDVT